MPIVVATVIPLPEFREEVLAALRASLPAVHQEAGCRLYALHDTGESFVFVEQWESDAALDQHNRGNAVREVVSRISGMLKEPVQILHARPIPGGDPNKGRLCA